LAWAVIVPPVCAAVPVGVPETALIPAAVIIDAERVGAVVGTVKMALAFENVATVEEL
jgi:hypothetical protein